MPFFTKMGISYKFVSGRLIRWKTNSSESLKGKTCFINTNQRTAKECRCWVALNLKIRSFWALADTDSLQIREDLLD